MRRRWPFTAWPFTDRAVPVVAWRLLILLAAVFAEAWNIANMLRSGEPPTEHFAYFTVQANLMVIALMAWLLLVPEGRRPRGLRDLLSARGNVKAGVAGERPEHMRRLLALLAAGEFDAVLQESMPLDGIARAYAIVDSRRKVGNLVVCP